MASQNTRRSAREEARRKKFKEIEERLARELQENEDAPGTLSDIATTSGGMEPLGETITFIDDYLERRRNTEEPPVDNTNLDDPSKD